MLGEKQVLTNKNVFFVAILMCSVIMCLDLMVYADSVIKKIVKLERENQKLNEEIIDRSRFELYKNKTLGGETCKWLLKNKESNDLWLFKIYKSSMPVNSAIVTYRLAQLLGLDMPEITKIILPINGRMQYGSIQKMIPNVISINEIPFNLLSVKQIESIMKNQVLDWIVFNSDVDKNEFLVEKETGKIIVIDKDETFYESESFFLKDNQGGDSYYYEFWKAYSESKININSVSIKKFFELIDYFQAIDNCYVVSIINDLLKNTIDSAELDSIIEKVISRKNNLRQDFENFYKDLAKKNDCFLQIPLIGKKNFYAQAVLKKLKKSVSQKRLKLDKIKVKKDKPQEDIKRLSCPDAAFLIEDLNYVSREEFMSFSKLSIEKLNCLKAKSISIYEQFVIDLYIEQIKNLQNKTGIENFVQRKIEQIVLYPEEITNVEILTMEYNLRAIYGEVRKEFKEYKKDVEEKPRNILTHLDYFQYPIGEGDEKEENLIVNKYKALLKKNPMNAIYEVLYVMVLGNAEYSEKIDDNFIWKHFGLGLIYSFDEERERAIEECNKALFCKNEGENVFCIHVLLGLLYEYNNRWERFGGGFDVKKSIKSYKEALKINPKLVKAHLNLGILCLIEEKPDEALKEFKEVNRLNPQYGKEHFHFEKINRRRLYRNKKKYLEAVRINTLSGRHHYILGLAYLIKKDRKLAQKHFSKAHEFGYEIKRK